MLIGCFQDGKVNERKREHKKISGDLKQTLINLLGDTEETLLFIQSLDFIIEYKFLEENHGNKYRSNSQRQTDLHNIALNIDRLLASMAIITQQPIETTTNHTAVRKNPDKVLMELISTKIKLNEEHKDKQYGFIIPEVINGLELLQETCVKVAEENFEKKRGNNSQHEEKLQDFERMIIVNYILSYKKLPAKTANGAFHNTIKIIYEIAGFPQSNSYQRLCKSIDRLKKDHPNLNKSEIKPTTKIHPNKKK
jgi:hypothetical protein